MNSVMRSLVRRALALMLAAASGAAAQEVWESVLKLQLETEQKCLLETYVSVRRLPIESLGAIEGRIRCIDGREFDFSRQRAHQKFELRICQPAVC